METPSTTLTPTPADQWIGASAFEGHDVELPSTNVARIKRINPTDFLKGGSIPDPLTDIIRRAIHTKKGLNPKELEKISDDPDKLASALEMIDRILTQVMVQPVVSMPPACDVAVPDGVCGEYANTDVHKTPSRAGHHEYHEGARQSGVLYADVVDISDKLFIFQWAVGGTNDLQQFREGLESGVVALQDSQGVPSKTK